MEQKYIIENKKKYVIYNDRISNYTCASQYYEKYIYVVNVPHVAHVLYVENVLHVINVVLNQLG